MVSSIFSLRYGESYLASTSISGCGCGDASIVLLTGLVAGFTDEMLESRKHDKCMLEKVSEGIKQGIPGIFFASFLFV